MPSTENGRREMQFQNGIAHLIAYKNEFGDLNIKQSYVSNDEFQLGVWVAARRKELRQGHLSPEHTKQLEDIGLSFYFREEHWDERYNRLIEYLEAGNKYKDLTRKLGKEGTSLKRWFQREMMLSRDPSYPKIKRKKMYVLVQKREEAKQNGNRF